MVNAMPGTDSQAVKDLREFDITLEFGGEQILKSVFIVDAETTAAELIQLIREDHRDVGDLLCLDVPSGKIRVHKGKKLVTIAEFRQSDGFLKAEGVIIWDQHGNPIE